MNWPLIGIWRLLVVLAVLDFISATMLTIRFAANRIVILIVLFAFASGTASMAAIAFWARDRWLHRIRIIRQ